MGWNWIYCRFIHLIPALETRAMPSPVDSIGLVVWRNICPRPPVASIVLHAKMGNVFSFIVSKTIAPKHAGCL